MKGRRWAVLGLVVVVAVGGGYYLYGRFLASSPAEPTRIEVPVRRGDLSATVSASGSIAMPHQAKLTFGAGGTVVTVTVEVGDRVEAGQVLAQLDTAPLQRALTQAQANLSTAQINLDKARQPYDAADIANAEAAVRDAQVALEAAERELLITQSSETYAKDVRDAQYEANWYDGDCGDAIAAFEDSSIDQDELTLRCNNAAEARERLEVAKQRASNALLTAQNNVAKAKDALRRAEEDLAEKRAGADHDDVKLKENQVTIAQTSLDAAKEDLAQATIVAPFSGEVAAMGADVGDKVTATTVVVRLVDTGQAEVAATLDELDAPQVNRGQSAIVTLDALPDLELSAKVASISPLATREAGVVNYTVTLELNPGTEEPLREGMTALAEIIVTEKKDVLLVPNRAVQSRDNRRFVLVMTDAGPEPRPVQVGMSDEQFTEIVEGLEEGEVVIVETGTATGRLPGLGGLQRGLGGGGGRPPGR